VAKITRDAIFTALETKVLELISPERFTEELLYIYEEQNYQAMGNELIEYGVFKSWFGKDYPWNYAEPIDEASWTLEKRWLMSLKNIDVNEISSILGRLRLNKHLTRITLEYRQLQTDILCDNGDRIKVYGALSDVPDVILDTLSKQQEYFACIDDYRKLQNNIQMESTGKKLIGLGVKQGPEIGRILKEIRNQWLMGNIKTVSEEKDFLERYLKDNKEENI